MRDSPDAHGRRPPDAVIVATEIEIEMPDRASALAGEGGHLDAIADTKEDFVRAHDLEGLVLHVHLLPEEGRP
jgi:hypothetical protein